MNNFLKLIILGGVLSHIRKVFRADLIEQLGNEHPTLVNAENPVQDPDLDDMSESGLYNFLYILYTQIIP